MADGKITFKIDTDIKQLRRDLSSAEKDYRKFANKIDKLDRKFDIEQYKKEKAFYGGATAKNLKEAERGYKSEAKTLHKLSDEMDNLLEKYPNMKKFQQLMQNPKIRQNKGLTKIFSNKLGVPLTALERYHDLSFGKSQSQSRLATKKAALEVAREEYTKGEAALPKLNEKQTQVKFDMEEAQIDLKNASLAADELKAKLLLAEKAKKKLLLKEKVKQGALGLLKKQAEGLIAPLKKAGKAMKSFNKRLKNAVVQGILLRPIREAFYGIYEAVANATKQNAQFTSSLANLKGTLWTAFVPVFEAVIPLLVRAMNAIATMITYISALVNALFKLTPASKKAGQALAASSKKGGNDKSFAKWDTVQQLQKKKSGDEGVAPTFEQSFEEAELALESLKKAVLEDDWFQVGVIIGQHLNNVITTMDEWINGKFQPFLSKFSLRFAKLLNGLNTGFDFPLLGKTVADGLNSIIRAFNTFFKEFDGLQFGRRLGDAIRSFVENLDAQSLGSAVSEFIIDFFGLFIGFIESMDWMLIGTKIIEFIRGINWSGLANALSEGIGAALGGLSALLIGLIGAGWSAVVEWAVNTFTEDGKLTIGSFLNGIVTSLINIVGWIFDNIFGPFISGFKKAFGITGADSTEMKDIGKKIAAGLTNGVATALANMKTIVNGIISIVEKGVNWIIDKLNLLHVDAPAWVKRKFGITGFGFDINRIHIPRLAQGSVVNPGHQFAAILGDNRREQEVVSPLSTMKQALTEALQESGMRQGGTVVLKLDGTEFARATYPYMQNETARLGTKAIGGTIR